MPHYRITVTKKIRLKGEQMDKGAFVDFQAWNYGNPIYVEKQRVADAFRNKYQTDIVKLGALNTSCLKVVRLDK